LSHVVIPLTYFAFLDKKGALRANRVEERPLLNDGGRGGASSGHAVIRLFCNKGSTEKKKLSHAVGLGKKSICDKSGQEGKLKGPPTL